MHPDDQYFALVVVMAQAVIIGGVALVVEFLHWREQRRVRKAYMETLKFENNGVHDG